MNSMQENQGEIQQSRYTWVGIAAGAVFLLLTLGGLIYFFVASN